MTNETAIPTPEQNEKPSDYADRVGAWYASRVTESHQKSYGLYLTPVITARFMASLAKKEGEQITILDPAAGSGVLACALAEELIESTKGERIIAIDAYEFDEALIEPLKKVFSYLKRWASKKKGVTVSVKVLQEDFILACAEAVQPSQGSLSFINSRKTYDLVIANPPYFKLPKSDPRAQATSSVVHGQPNIYALFMAVSAGLLNEGGELVFITPRSFASGPYFRLFRERFFKKILPVQIHVFDSRTEAFKRDEVLQENIIFKGRRAEGWEHSFSKHMVVISSSHGAGDIAKAKRHTKPLSDLLDMKSRSKVLRLPISENDDSVLDLIDSWTGSLHSYGLEISTGPVVPFRATQHLQHQGKVAATHAPLLWMHHVRAMNVCWPNGTRKPQYILNQAKDEKLLVKNANYVLLRRFSAKEEKRRLTAGPYLSSSYSCSMVGLENHLNYIHRPGGTLTDDEAYGLSALYNSELFDRYFRAINGNTQVSATELREMPLPEMNIIRAIGKRIKKLKSPLEKIDDIVSEVLVNTTIKEAVAC